MRKGFLWALLGVVVLATWINAVVETTEPYISRFTEVKLISSAASTLILADSTGTVRDIQKLGRIHNIIILNESPSYSIRYGSSAAITANDSIRWGSGALLPKRSAYHTTIGDALYGISLETGTGVGGSTVSITYEFIKMR